MENGPILVVLLITGLVWGPILRRTSVNDNKGTATKNIRMSYKLAVFIYHSLHICIREPSSSSFAPFISTSSDDFKW